MLGFWRKRETRESTTYTDQAVAAAVQAATGTTDRSLIATVEACCGLWERGFAAGVSTVLEPWKLALIGRSLLLTGQSVWWSSARSGLLPVSDHDITGRSATPARWSYRLSLPTPSTTLTRKAPAAQVLHVRIGATARRPWAGCSPLANAAASRSLLEAVERSLTDEHGGPVGSVVGVPDPSGSQAVVDEIANLRGRLIAAEASELDLAGEGASGRTSWKPNRVGPQPAAATPTARQDVERSLLAAAGIPVELVQPSSGSDAREGWRRFLHATIAPAAALVSAELRRLGLESEIAFDALRASDIAGRARAFQSLVGGGMPVDRAAALSGLVVADD